MADRRRLRGIQIWTGIVGSSRDVDSVAFDLNLEILEHSRDHHVRPDCEQKLSHAARRQMLAQRVELAGYTAIFGLMTATRPLLFCSKERFQAARSKKREDSEGRKLLLEPKLLALFPGRYLKVYDHAVAQFVGQPDERYLEWNARAHLIVDFISGMTDDFAMTTYRTLAGMRL